MARKTASEKVAPDSGSVCQGIISPQAFIVNRNTVLTTIKKLESPHGLSKAIRDVKKMLEIKEALLWRTEMSPCCGSLSSLSSCLACEVDLLARTLTALENGDKEGAARLLEEYAHMLEVNREPPEPSYR